MLSWGLTRASAEAIIDDRYEVAAGTADGRLVCNCPAGTYPKTSGRCWHIRAVASGVVGKPTVRYQPTPRLSLDDLYAPAPVISGSIMLAAL